MVLSAVKIRIVMVAHAAVCIALGIACVILPHKIASSLAVYDHMAHEYTRLYGCLTLSVGWFVWSTQKIKDGRLIRAISETFAICYMLQSVVLVRAQLTNPQGHSLLHWIVSFLFIALGVLYTLVRTGTKLKDFELPGNIQDD